jgi:hypothetical protein
MQGYNAARGVTMLGAPLVAGCGDRGEQRLNDMGNMPMPAPAARAASAAPATGNVEVTLTTQPDPPPPGAATFEAMVTQDGPPVTDADVSVERVKAATLSMNMPDMKHRIALKHEGYGPYRGAGNVMMAGNWDATVSVKRGGHEIGSRKVTLVAK